MNKRLDGIHQRRIPEMLKAGFWLFALVVIGSWIAGCGNGKPGKKYSSPMGYDLEHPIKIKLPLQLDEISGVAFYMKDTSVFAINDEYGQLYKIYLNRPHVIQRWPFAPGADFEDLAFIDSNFYVLVSNGDIICFRFITRDSLYRSVFKFPFGTENEFEILYYDPEMKKIVLICKDCESDKKKYLSTYSFDPWTYKYEESNFHIDVTSITALLGEKKMKFKPSAAAIHPVTGELYIVSAVNDLLVVASRDGKAKQVYRMDGGLFKQPEGLAFSPGGTMIISNEAADIGVANLLIFPYEQKAQR